MPHDKSGSTAAVKGGARMSLAPGTRLGPYEIMALLGAGGMGEVYRARDTKLGREVAIKVLPAGLADHPEALLRFEREANAVAQLSHPNILAIHDFGREGEIVYAVMELLDGETLRARLSSGALPARKAVDLAAQIAEGLAAAHEKGIIHRDLKPENVFVTLDGRVKLLDFGLAKRKGPGGGPDSGFPTIEHTGPGTVMGTARYMSPEQVRGEAVDHCSDIFSFGAVLYEMLTGKRAFGRETPAESMTAILKEDPPEITANGSAPSPALERIVRHCLEKKPGERFQSARDIAFALHALSGSAITGMPAPVAARRGWRPRLLGFAGAVVLVVGGLALYRAGQKAERRLAEGVIFRQMNYQSLPIFQAFFGPDGESVVYSAALEGNVPELYILHPEYPDPRPLGLPRTHLLAISSKGELAVLTKASFIAHRQFTGTLAHVPLGGTAPREILEDVSQADWSPDGSALAAIHEVEGKNRLEFPIGHVLYETAGYLSDPRFSPSGDRVALFDHPSKGDDRGTVIVVDLSGGRKILAGPYWGEEGLAWSPDGGEVLFTATAAGRAQTLYGVTLSGRLRVALRSAGGLTMHDISRNGRWLVTRDDWRNGIAALPPGAAVERDLSWLDYSLAPYLSHDGRLLLFQDASVTAGLNYAVCLRGTDGGPVVRLGEGAARGLSPDAKWALAIVHNPPQVVVYPTGAGEALRLPLGDLQSAQGASWFPDGKHVIVRGNEPGKVSRCYAQDVAGGLPRPITPEGTSNCLVSPDALRILYAKPDGTWQLQRLQDGATEIMPGLTPGDQVIRWSADGRGLCVYRPSQVPFRLERLDLATARRELIREVAPLDRTGVLNGWGAALTDDYQSYAYDYARMTSQLFVVEGAR